MSPAFCLLMLLYLYFQRLLSSFTSCQSYLEHGHAPIFILKIIISVLRASLLGVVTGCCCLWSVLRLQVSGVNLVVDPDDNDTLIYILSPPCFCQNITLSVIIFTFRGICFAEASSGLIIEDTVDILGVLVGKIIYFPSVMVDVVILVWFVLQVCLVYSFESWGCVLSD